MACLRFLGREQPGVVFGQDFFEFDIVANPRAGEVGFLVKYDSAHEGFSLCAG